MTLDNKKNLWQCHLPEPELAFPFLINQNLKKYHLKTEPESKNITNCTEPEPDNNELFAINLNLNQKKITEL